ncbi:AFG1-like ATPase-domain-containing protein [Russula vinacea]|nr:AFG1-like ATPase-domain-containing protein [Russula vinacea]
MLMDIFYDTPPTRIAHKRRVHFHAFILDVHKRMHAAKAAGAGDPLLPVARDLANEAHVTDIADAMILRWLLDTLLEHGVTILFQSRHPDDLYKNGIQRTSFIPAIDLLKAQFDVTGLDSGTGIPIQEGKTIRLWGRNLTVPRCAGHVAQFTFAELCGRPLGAADYLEITQRFRTLFMTDVPRMGLAEKNKDPIIRIVRDIFEIFSDDSSAGTRVPASDNMRAI